MRDLTMKQVASVVHAFQSSQVQYDDKFLLLFSSYNSWYRSVTGESIDARALRAVKLRDALWGEYLRGECLERLRPLMRRITLLTRIRPLRSGSLVDGVLTGPDDWEGLIEFWYTIRCDIVHGNATVLEAHYPVYAKLAYETLQIFMTEVVMRLQINVQTLAQSDKSKVRMLPRLDEVDLYPRRQFIRQRRKLLKRAQSPLLSGSKHFTS